MKNSVKISALFIFSLVLSGIMYSCQKDASVDANALNDDQLIEAIQTATNKQAIIEDELPTTTQYVIANDYYESFTNQALLAPNLGYEVELRKGKGSQVGELHATYFDTNGNQLVSGGSQYAKGGKQNGQGKQGNSDKGRKDCFDFEFPITLTMPDASTITIEDKDSWTIIKEWYTENPESVDRPSINFPVDIVYADGTTATIISEEELQTAHQECNEGRPERCFELVYPVTWIMPDESEIEVSERGDRDAIKAWYEGNPEAVEKPGLKYPVEIMYADSTIVLVNSEEEMITLKDSCKTYQMHAKCFDFVYPVTFVMPDSSTIVIETVEDRLNIKAWYEANPDVTEKPTLQFPIDIIYQDGTTVTVNSQEEMQILREECAANREGRGKQNGRNGQGDNGNGNGGQGGGNGQGGRG